MMDNEIVTIGEDMMMRLEYLNFFFGKIILVDSVK
jgi:hypothetical protein